MPIVNNTVNDIAVTVLEGAPIDPATGLPVPTIAVATAGGVSVILASGAVVNSVSTSPFNAVSFDRESVISSISGLARYGRSLPVASLSNGFNYSGITYLTSTSTPALPIAVSGKSYAGRYASADGLALIKENPTTPAKGMVAKISNTFNSGYEIGDSRFAGLADTVAETITAPEMFSAGDVVFTDRVDWVGSAFGASFFGASSKQHKLRFTLSGIDSGEKLYLFAQNSAALGPFVANGDYVVNSVPIGSQFHLTFTPAGGAGGINTFTVSNISCKLAEPDRSVKSNGLAIVGSLVKTAVAAGAQLVAYSGFTAANYLEQPYSANLDFGTGDFGIGWWEFQNNASQQQVRMSRGTAAAVNSFDIRVDSSLTYKFIAAATSINSGISQITGDVFCFWVREAGVIKFYLNGALVYSVANSTNLTLLDAPLRVGTNSGSSPIWTGVTKMTLLRLSATAPSADQIAQIYRDELPLFQPGAQCTIAGTSTAVTALAYDESTDLLHVGTSWGRSAFKGLRRTESEATTTGAITSISAAQGAVLTGGTSAKIWQPALLLRDELARKEEAKRALGKVPVFTDFTATASQTAFVLAVGYTVKALYRNGVLMRETTTGVFWTRSFDGYRETATLSVGATVGDWISLMCIRNN